MTNRTMPYHCIKRKKDKKSRNLLLYGKERYKEILFTDETNFTVEEIFNKQTIEFMHGHPRKPAN